MYNERIRMATIESTILTHLIHDEEYTRKVLPFIKDEYFQNSHDKVKFKLISEFFVEYNTLPTREALLIELDNDGSVSEDDFDSVTVDINAMDKPEKTDDQWLLDNTEKFCQEKAIYNGIMESIAILDDGGSTKSTGSIPDLLTDALSVCFDNHIGHDFLEDADSRFSFYHTKVERIKFNLEYFNLITAGGLPKKTLNVILAGTGVGKTLAMTHMAGGFLLDGLNVLYITMEMAEERIAERIDANLLNVTLDDLKDLPKDMYDKKLGKVKGKTAGKLIIKEYPTASAGAGHFRHLLNELKLKRDFMPDVVFIDYLNICTSMRVKNSQANSYTIVKSIAEELRGLAVEKNLPIITATQTTRSGFTSSDIGLEDTSESFGLPATADFMMAMIATEELTELGQVMFKQLKNRYGDETINRRFVVGIDKSKMRLFDVDQKAQTVGADEDKPVMDSTEYGERAHEEEIMKWSTKKMGRKDFSGFK